MPKKPKNPMQKFRSAIRLIWSRSAERKAILQAALFKDPKTGHKMFKCSVCAAIWHEAMAQVDHIPPLGALSGIDELSDFTKRMFYGPQRVIDKLCHKKITAEQRRKK